VGAEHDKKIITSLVRPLSSACSLRSASCGTASTRSSTRSEKCTGREIPSSKESAREATAAMNIPEVLTKEELEIRKLKDERLVLENDLLRVTKKLHRKYEKAVFPSVHDKASTYQSLSKTWSNPNLTEDQMYKVYMNGRYATRNNLEFYKKKPEKRDETNNFHRRHKQHTKYGDSLAITKHSLRGKF
jgi:hypothetical protein